jgi:ferric-dicitrate binding protein FerR (iron transport regulator)
MDIDKIISSYLNEGLSEREQKKLDEWLAEDPSHQDQFDALTDIWKTPFQYPEIVNIEDEQRKIWSRLSGERDIYPGREEKKVFRIGIVLRYAAIFLIAFGLGYVFWLNTEQPVEEQSVAVTIERNNPLGQKSKILLPDGSTVWLNAGSKLTYDNEYNFMSRRLELEGEAYFEVAKNEQLPFQVFTDDLVITALGTAFNVNAFSNQDFEKVALRTGKVRVECLDNSKSNCNASYLNPGDLAQYHEGTGAIDLTDFGNTDPFGWKDGRIVFHHATFNEVVEMLERWYNVEFIISGKLKQEWNYSTTFENEVLENILESLKYSERIDYEMEGTIVKIKL